MATLALQAAGTAVAGPVGGIVGGFIGNFLDQRFLFPAIFPEDDVQGPRIDSLQVGSSTEDAPHSFPIGREIKVPGNTIWVSKVRVRQVEEEVGGKGGPSQTITTEEAIVDLAIDYGLMQAGNQVFPLNDDAVRKVWANGTLIYDADADVSIASTSLSVEALDRFGDVDVPAGVTTVYQEVVSPSGGPDLTDLRSGSTVTIAGFSNSGNNGTFRVKTAWAPESPAGETRFRVENNAAVDESAGASVTITQNNPELEPGVASAVTFYPGDWDQTADPTIVAEEGVDEVPAYRGKAYAVFKDFNASRFNGTLPGTWQVLLDTDLGAVSIRTAFERILTRTRRPVDEWDATGVSTDEMRGHNVLGTRPIAQQLQPLMLAFDVKMQERDGVMYFFSRENAEVVDVVESDLAAHQFGGDAPRPIDVAPRPNVDLPREVTVSYLDPDAEFQPATQRYRRNDAVSEQVANMRLDVTMSAAQAQCKAREFLWTAYANKLEMSLSLPPSYLRVLENDVLRFDFVGEERDVLLRQVDRGSNFLLRYSGQNEVVATLSYAESECNVDESRVKVQRLYVPPELDAFVLDVAPMSDEVALDAFLLWGVATADPSALFRGGVLYESRDDGSSFDRLAEVSTETTMGSTETELGSASVGLWDRVNTLTVEVISGTLSSRTEDDVLDGANRAIVGGHVVGGVVQGGEIVGFVNATAQSPIADQDPNVTRYVLDTLLRGLRDTEDEIDNHAPNELFVLLNSPGVQTRRINLAALNTSRDYRAVAAQGDPDDFGTQVDDLPLEGNSLRHFSPDQVEATRDGSGTITITWTRRTRAMIRILGNTSAPLLDDDQIYEVDVLSGPNVVRTITETTSANGSVVTPGNQTAVYDDDDQVDDFGSTQDPLTVRIYQVSTRVGRSKPREVTI